MLSERCWSDDRGFAPRAVCAALTVLICGAAATGQASPFATRVIEYAPAPGQLVNDPMFNDPMRALGAPVGGGVLSADLSKLVTLGGFGGSIILGFDRRIPNLRVSLWNPSGADFIVFGNAFLVGGNASRRWAEPGVIEVALDANNNHVADDQWFVIGGSHLPVIPASARAAQTWDDNTADPAFPPAIPSWIPEGRSGSWVTQTFALTDPLFAGPVLINPSGPGDEAESVWGYADCTPVMVLGDLDGDGAPDDQSAFPEEFYARPDDPFARGVSGGTGGGDSIDIDWAVDPATGAPAQLPGIDFVRISSAVATVSPLLGERSTEVGAVAIVREPADFNGDGLHNPDDLSEFITCFFLQVQFPGFCPQGDFNHDGLWNPDDLSEFITAFFLS
jgi:hypothetical protein